jgi:hypothetical protein
MDEAIRPFILKRGFLFETQSLRAQPRIEPRFVRELARSLPLSSA